MASSFGEFYLFYKNLGDVEAFASFPLWKRAIKRVGLAYNVLYKVRRVDPIQEVVITENILSVLGVSVPLITSTACYLTGLGFFDAFGCILNGLVQIKLSRIIMFDNARILIGKSMPKSDALVSRRQKIKHILEDREGVDVVEELKSEYITSNTLKIAATIKYDQQEIAQNVLEVLEPDVQKVSADPVVQAEVRKLLRKSTDILLTYTSEMIKDMEDDIREEFPYVTEIDLEQSLTNIQKQYQGLIPLGSDDEADKKKIGK